MNQLLFSSTKRVIIFLQTVLLALTATASFASESFSLSKNADFSTDDRNFAREDTLFMRIVAPEIDFNDIKDNELRVKPEDGGNDFRGSLTNNLDGTYTAMLALSTLDKSENEWEWRAKIKDNQEREFEARVDFRIGGDDDGDDNSSEIEFTGVIDQIGQDHIVVAGATVFVDSATVILNDNKQTISLNDLQVGQLVEVKSVRRGDGNLWALRIKTEDEDDDEVEVTGAITALTDSSLTVASITFLVGANTTVLDNDNNSISFSDLVAGMTVEVRADRQAGGSLLASKIKIEDAANDEIEITGVIDSLGTDFMFVSGLKFSVNENTVVLDRQKSPISFVDLQTGQLVEVRADRQFDGSLLALRIKLEDGNNDEVELTGRIDALGVSSLVVQGLTFEVNDATVILNNNNAAIAFSDLQIGQIVEVRADRQTDSSLLATKVKIEDRTAIFGKAQNVSATALTIANAEIGFSENTIFINRDFAPIAKESIQAGQSLTVQAVRLNDTQQYFATIVKTATPGTVTSIASDERPSLPADFALEQNYPNPFNPSTTIRFTLTGVQKSQFVTLTIHNILGQQVRTLVSQTMNPGSFVAVWDGRNDSNLPVASGMYHYRLRIGKQVAARSMILSK